ncbi:MAG: T9SS type A sorting domain-containing protein, partial [Bacteroidota bacterium]
TFMLAASASAQVIGELPDPLSFYPLTVGNAWEYSGPSAFVTPMRREVLKDTLIDGKKYFVVVQRVVEDNGYYPGPRSYLLRYDLRRAQVLERRPNGSEVALFETPCTLRLTVGEGECTYEDSLVLNYRIVLTDVAPIEGGGSTPAYMYFDSLAGSLTLASGFGMVSNYGDASSFGIRLYYARINGVEHGEAQLEYLTEVSAVDETPPAPFSITSFPNPTHASTTLRIEMPEQQDVRIAVFDVLGRSVWQDERYLNASTSAVAIDSSSWPAGVYFVQVQTSNGGTYTVQKTKR